MISLFITTLLSCLDTINYLDAPPSNALKGADPLLYNCIPLRAGAVIYKTSK